MPVRKLTLEIDIDDDAVDRIEDIEREILAQDICGQATRKYLASLQDGLAQQVEIRKGSKKVRVKIPHFEFDFHAKRTLDETRKNVHSTLFQYFRNYRVPNTIPSHATIQPQSPREHPPNPLK